MTKLEILELIALGMAIMSCVLLAMVSTVDGWVFNHMVDSDCAMSCYYQCKK